MYYDYDNDRYEYDYFGRIKPSIMSCNHRKCKYDGVDDVYLIIPNWEIKDGICMRYLPRHNELVLRDLLEYLNVNPALFYKPNCIINRISKKYRTFDRNIVSRGRIRAIRVMNVDDASLYIRCNYSFIILENFLRLMNSVYDKTIDKGRFVHDSNGEFYYRVKTCGMWRVNPYSNTSTIEKVYESMDNVKNTCKEQYESYTGNKIDVRTLKPIIIENTWDDQKSNNE